MPKFIDTAIFLERAKKVHGDRYLYEKSVYVSVRDKVIITCRHHGDFLQSPSQHVRGHGCEKCNRAGGRKPIPRSDIHMSQNPDGTINVGLTRGAVAVIDCIDAECVSKYNWYLSKRLYPASSINGRAVMLHRFILDPERAVSMEIDHIDGDPLNNTRANLRFCTRHENMQNIRPYKGRSSVYKGVWRDKERGKWQAEITAFGKNKKLGRFDCEIEAAKAFDIKAKELHGEFAYLNFPDK